MHNALFEQIAPVIEGANRIVLLNPKSPDGDSVGSALALWHGLDAVGKESLPMSLTPPSDQFIYLPGIEQFATGQHETALREADCIIAVDFADPKMSGLEDELDRHRASGKPIVVFDHHPTNTNFGTINVVDPTLASTTELIYHFFEYLHWAINTNIATCLLTGIISDTSHFRNLNTTYSVIHVASRLLAAGARHRDITQHTVKNKSTASLKLWGLALSRLTQHPSFDIAWTVITQEDIKTYNVDDEAIDGIANFLNNLSGASAVLVLRETPDGELKGSLRTTTPGVDVSRLAQIFGGGGHKKAAGFTIRGRLEKTLAGWQVKGNRLY